MADKPTPTLPPPAQGAPPQLETTQEFKEETSIQKFKRRLKEEPLIPLGCAATCYALYRAYRSMKAKDSYEMNRMFRARIYAQFFTLIAVVAGGMYYRTERQQRKEFERALEVRKSAEKRDAWLKELEVRDKEDKGWRERHAALAEAEVTPADKNRAVVEDADRTGIESGNGLGIVDAVRDLLASSRRR